jgi:hypothetical protein
MTPQPDQCPGEAFFDRNLSSLTLEQRTQARDALRQFAQYLADRGERIRRFQQADTSTD